MSIGPAATTPGSRRTDEKTEQGDLRRELDALAWVGRTRDALDDGRLVLYSQPLVLPSVRPAKSS